MKKKPSSSSSSSSSLTYSDLKTLIRSHSVFFDELVSLIPPKFYLAGADEDDRPYYKGLSKAAKASFKKQSRENTKKSRRERFNPDAPSSTLDLLHKSIENQNPNPSEQNPNPNLSPGAVTYEELRQRLRRRIEELRSGRNTRPKPDDHKRKREQDEDGNGDGNGDGDGDGGDILQEERQVEKEKKDLNLNPTDLSYGQVKIGDEDGKRRKKKRVSKVLALEKAKRLEELKKDPEKGEAVSRKHSWKAAASRAAGEKVHDDPKLLKESIKKEKKRQQKHAEKWKERVESQASVRKEKQKTRAGNIKDRIQQKKMRRIEKREKKLMRPGFEGRKEGYING